MGNSESKQLREGIRSGMIDCLGPTECDRNLAQHSPRCPWQNAVERIYQIERELEGITNV